MDARILQALKRERASNAHSSKCRENCSGDYPIQGLPHSTAQEEDHTHKKAVKKLIHQFEKHPNREALKADLRQNQAYNPSGGKSKNLIHSMGNVEYFLTVQATGRQVSYIAHVEPACISQRKRDK